MRKIDIQQYSCPICAAQLIPDGVNFSFGSPGEEMTRQNYKCSGCPEQFYSLEEAYVLPADKTPEFTCFYCGAQCTYLSLQNDWTDYWKCTPCKATFSFMYNKDWADTDIISLFTTINNKLYVLRQFLREGTSRIEMLPDNEEDTIVIAYEFKFLMPSVNPTNIHEKLPTYMLFS